MESGGDVCRRRFEFRKIPSPERPRLTLLPGLAEFILMVEMELDDTFIALARRCDAVSIPTQHVAGETVYSLFRFHDFLVGRTPIRHFECVAGIIIRPTLASWTKGPACGAEINGAR